MKILISALLSSVVLLSGIVGAKAETPATTLVMVGSMDDIQGFDPAAVAEYTAQTIINNVYDRLMRYEPEDLGKLVPSAAESYSMSEDGRVFTFTLRPGQKFHSGNPLTAEDVAFSFQRVVKLNLAEAYLFNQLGWTADTVDEMVKAVDPATVELHVGSSVAPNLILNLLASVPGSIVDKKLVLENEKDGDLGREWLKTATAGSGPFSLRSWTANETLVLDSNPDYRLGAPAMTRVVFRHVPEPAAQRLVLEQGDADVALNLTADQLQDLEGKPGVTIVPGDSAITWYLGLNQKDERLANPKVQQAVRYLVDYDGMAGSFLKGQYKVHQTFWPAGFSGSLDENPYKFDPARAKELLAEAGYPDGFEIRLDCFNNPPSADICQSIQQTMAEGGIKVDLVLAERKQVLTQYRARQHQMVYAYWIPDYLDPQANATSFTRNLDNSDKPQTQSVAWRNAWDIPELTKKTEEAFGELDTAKRQALLDELQTTLLHEGPIITLFQATPQYARRSNVDGFVLGPMFNLVYFRTVTKQ